MVLDRLLSFIYPPPPSLITSAMSLIGFASLTNGGYMEIKGKHMQYSKFLSVGSVKSSNASDNKAKISSRKGMLISYTPAFLAAAASLVFLPAEGLRFALVRFALAIHFFQRVFEVVFIHKYSGQMDVETTINISLSYFLFTATMIYAQHLTQGFSEPAIDLKYAGILLFLVGISGNFFHHFLLSKLRSNG